MTSIHIYSLIFFLSLLRGISSATGTFNFENFRNVTFVGHISPDSDSVASSIAAAYLYGGFSSRSGTLNQETKFLLNKFQMEEPPDFISLQNEHNNNDNNYHNKRICLVDFNQLTQFPRLTSHNSHHRTPIINDYEIVCVIDHHAIQNDVVTSPLPIHFEIKPWGSCSTVISWKFFEENVDIPKQIASLLLGGIISDTLFLRSPTTTQADIIAVERLKRLSGIEDVATFAMELFTAKSTMDETQENYILSLMRRDFKSFRLSVFNFGFSVIETIYPESILKIKKLILEKIPEEKVEKGLDYLFIGLVDIIGEKTILFLETEQEKNLALTVYPGATVFLDEHTIDIGSRVSRKKDLIPPLHEFFSSTPSSANVIL